MHMWIQREGDQNNVTVNHLLILNIQVQYNHVNR